MVRGPAPLETIANDLRREHPRLGTDEDVVDLLGPERRVPPVERADVGRVGVRHAERVAVVRRLRRREHRVLLAHVEVAREDHGIVRPPRRDAREDERDRALAARLRLVIEVRVEVVQVYIKKLNDPSGPLKTLRAFKRIEIAPGKSSIVSIRLSSHAFEFYNEKQGKVLTDIGDYEIWYGNSSDTKDLRRLTITIK
ncbi:hypothetical protein EON81_29480 [bacterium]|nr:MAG: hypothetical protein EON81_29480 [bacterium]